MGDPNVQPVDFFKTADAEIPPETICNSTGWGLTTGGGLFLPNHLQWIQIPLHSAADCETIFPGYITENMVCAGSAGRPPAMETVAALWSVLMLMGSVNCLVLSPSDTPAAPMRGSTPRC